MNYLNTNNKSNLKRMFTVEDKEIKKYYTFKEILITLREEYKKNQLALNRLNNLIKLDNKYNYNIEQKLKNLDEEYKIILSVEEKQKMLEKIYNWMISNIELPNNKKITSDKKVEYEINNTNDIFEFNIINTSNEKLYTSITVLNNEIALRNYKQLFSSKLSKIAYSNLDLQNNLNLKISGKGIQLKNKIEYINYNSYNDSLNINVLASDFFTLLNTKIDSSLLSFTLNTMINNCNKKQKNVIVEDKLSNGSYAIHEIENEFILIKRK